MGAAEDKRRGLKARLRRVTYELGPIAPASRRGTRKNGNAVREYVYTDDGEPVLTPGDSLNTETGVITRSSPWAPNRPSPWTCYLTDAEWELDDLKYADFLYDLPMHKATYQVRSDGEVLDRLDLMVDFIPLVHITNSIPTSGEHWGKPTIATVLQALDELSATDTDSSGASATTGSPIIGLAGARLPIDRATGQPLPVKVRAGTVWQLNDNGRMDVLDTTAQLAELRARLDHILDRIAANSRLTAAGLGTLDRPPCHLATLYSSRSDRWTRSSPPCAWPAITSSGPAAHGAATSPGWTGARLAHGGEPARPPDVGTANSASTTPTR
ncbi:hypothetical protein ACWCXK_06255 [Streptomyces sp. NPDC001739]